MSTLKVDAIRHNSATSDAITTAADGTCTAKLTSVGGGQLSHRNLIINGAMLISQRGQSSTSTGYKTVDRFKYEFSGTDEAPTQEQVDVASGTTPYTLGFRKSYKITNGNQTRGAGAADYVGVEQRIEAQNVVNSGWNYTSPSSFVTLSFWVKSSVAQNFYGYLFTEDGAERLYSFETGSLTADTWTKITKTIPGNSIVQINNDNGFGLQIQLWAFMGTNYTASGSTLNQWKVWNGSERIPDMTSTWYTTNDATFEITGMQLEVGDTATSFEHRSYGDELARCGRYYQKISGSNGTAIAMAFNYNTTLVDWVAQYPMGPMRASPSLDQVNGSDYFRYQGGGQSANFLDGAFVIEQIAPTQANIYFDPDNNLTAGGIGYIITNNNAAYLAFSSEL